MAGSLPATLLEAWHSEREDIVRTARNQKRELSEHEQRRLNYLHIDRIENYLDEGKGDCWLANPEVAKIVADAIQHFDGKRYVLYSWCIMPNHVHVLFSPFRLPDQSASDSLLIPILHSWKSYTASKANQILKRKGKFWQEEYFDTIVRTESQFAFYVRYILENPVTAKLCKTWPDWSWSGCSLIIVDLLKNETGGQACPRSN